MSSFSSSLKSTSKSKSSKVKELKDVRVNLHNIDPDVDMTANWKRKGKHAWVGFIRFNNWEAEQKKEIAALQAQEEEERANASSWYNPYAW